MKRFLIYIASWIVAMFIAVALVEEAPILSLIAMIGIPYATRKYGEKQQEEEERQEKIMRDRELEQIRERNRIESQKKAQQRAAWQENIDKLCPGSILESTYYELYKMAYPSDCMYNTSLYKYDIAEKIQNVIDIDLTISATNSAATIHRKVRLKLKSKLEAQYPDGMRLARNKGWDESSLGVHVAEIKEMDATYKAQKKNEEERRNKSAAVATFKRVSDSWERIGGVPVYYLFWYYPMNCQDVNVSELQASRRRMIWNFKDGHPDSGTNFVIKVLKHFFDSNALKHITLVCVPASSEYANIKRYDSFAKEVCSATGMENSFEYIHVRESREAKHLGGSDGKLDNVDFNSDFFRGRNVLLFDDLVTRGQSLALMKAKMESLGATVIGAITLGKTVHHDCGTDPIDKL